MRGSGGGQKRKKTEFEITSCGIVSRGEFLTRFSRRRRTEWNGCQKRENSIALLEHSFGKRWAKVNVLTGRRGGANIRVCKKMKLPGRGAHVSEKVIESEKKL